MLLLIGFNVVGLVLLAAEVVCQLLPRVTCKAIEERPKTCAENVRFVLFTRSDRTNGQVLRVAPDENIDTTHFNAANPTKVIIHDFMDGINEPSHYYIRTEYLKKGEYNLIMVDWGYLAQGPIECRYRAHQYTGHVGKCTAVLIEMLRNKYSLTDVHVIGLGLGAVTIHSIAINVKSKLTRATGLDPSGTIVDKDKYYRIETLKQSDADFVDVIHTNFDVVKVNKPIFGTMDQVGHVDYYVNYGQQPDCWGNFLKLYYDDNCCHRRSIQFYTESINIGKGFYGGQCESLKDYIGGSQCSPSGKVLMGEYALNTTRGVVRVSTANESPYSLGPM